MNIVLTENPTFKADVILDGDVGFTAIFKAVPPWSLGKDLPEDASAEVKGVLINAQVIDLVTGWEGVNNEQGEPVPFDKDTLLKLLQLPKATGALIEAYATSYGIEAAKN
jgi:hypothetical protein